VNPILPVARYLNNATQIVADVDWTVSPPLNTHHGFILNGGMWQDLDTVDSPAATFVDGVNDSGQVIGHRSVGLNSGTNIFFWSAGSFQTIFADSGGYWPEGVNKLGQVVGITGALNAHPYVWQDGQDMDLNQLIDANSGWILMDATAINDLGQIVGTGSRVGANDGFHGFMLDPCQDSDKDGLCDTWETEGVTVQTSAGPVFVDLPAMGARPDHKDIFIQTDYMVCLFSDVLSGNCNGTQHSHAPMPEAINLIIKAFADSPVNNPDKKTGINLHVDCGFDCVMNPETGEKWGGLSMAHALPHADMLGDVSKQTFWPDFDKLKQKYFPESRLPIFHYAIFAHQYPLPDETGTLCSGGNSRTTPGSDFLIALGCSTDHVGSTHEQAGAFMHELGHNLGLRHGGDLDVPLRKPNYLSVMNYFWIGGLWTVGPDCRTVPGLYDYSRFGPASTLQPGPYEIPSLDESSLDENIGLNTGAAAANYGTLYKCVTNGNLRRLSAPHVNAPIDWNCDGAISLVAADIDGNGEVDRSLGSFDDWANLNFRGGSIGVLGAASLSTALSARAEVSPMDDDLNPNNFKVVLSGRGIFTLAPSSSTTLHYTITNAGSEPDVYTVAGKTDKTWANLGSVPTSLSIASGASSDIPVLLNVPPSVSLGDTANVVLTATSQTSERILDVAAASVLVSDSLTLSVQSITFAPQLAGTSSPAATLNMRNILSSAINFTNINLGGTSSLDFSKIADCGKLMSVASCSFNITFTPTATGTRNASLTLSDSAGMSHTVLLTGSGTDFAINPLANAGSTSATVTSGQAAIYNLELDPVGVFSGTVTLICSGSPSAARSDV
jgi:probable HAF family extracellular repeat protein